MRNKNLKLDERDLVVFRKVCTVLYLITLYSMIGVLLYRQFVLHQPNSEWNDIAILVTINVFAFLGALLFIGGGVRLQNIKVRHLVFGFAGFVAIGFAFTLFKYGVLLGQELKLGEVWGYLYLIVRISALIALGLGVLAYLGNRRIERQIEG